MKTWIIALAIVFVVLRIAREGLKNFIQNDHSELVKYHFSHGDTPAGIMYAIFYILSKLVMWVEVILVIIFLVDMV